VKGSDYFFLHSAFFPTAQSLHCIYIQESAKWSEAVLTVDHVEPMPIRNTARIRRGLGSVKALAAPKTTVASKPVDLKSETIYAVTSVDSFWSISKKECWERLMFSASRIIIHITLTLFIGLGWLAVTADSSWTQITGMSQIIFFLPKFGIKF
jgi:hypothetical protein